MGSRFLRASLRANARLKASKALFMRPLTRWKLAVPEGPIGLLQQRHRQQQPQKEDEQRGCWIPHRLKAPCPEDIFEYKGECYMVSMETQPLPQSLRR
ncbi:MAG TPA: hypothetical protein VLQ93_14725 [Myxococcaceae bacterium]|nr:hypothetical protein [Myxococcaceae bacterium]